RSARRNDIRVSDNQAASLSAVAAQSSAATQQASTSAESSINVSDELVKFLAETGLSRSKEIKEEFARHLKKLNRGKGSSHVRDDLIKAENVGYVVRYTVSLESKGASIAFMYELSDAGIKRAKALGVSPVESEVVKGKRAHTSLEHFYQIMDVGDVLKHAGYQVSLYESSISFQDGTKYVPDIKAIGPDGRLIYVEVERTPKGADDLENKYVRAAVLCNGDLFIGVINKGKARKVGEYALEIKARRSNAIKRIFVLNVGNKKTLWQEIEQMSDLGVADGSDLDADDDSQEGEN
ncbi:MAG: hypothetical protein AAB570_00320, partial [Patescibacteria group bacterium]